MWAMSRRGLTGKIFTVRRKCFNNEIVRETYAPWTASNKINSNLHPKVQTKWWCAQQQRRLTTRKAAASAPQISNRLALRLFSGSKRSQEPTKFKSESWTSKVKPRCYSLTVTTRHPVRTRPLSFRRVQPIRPPLVKCSNRRRASKENGSLLAATITTC